MGRRSSGWTVVKAIARDIDRANRQAQRTALAEHKAYIREQERSQREEQKFLERGVRDATRSQERFNNAMSAANTATSITIKEKKLSEARQHLADLKNLERQYAFLDLQNLLEVEKGIEKVQQEVGQLKSQEEENQSLERIAATNTATAQKIRDGIENVLLHTLTVNDALDWDDLKDRQVFLIAEPVKPPKPMSPPKPQPLEIPQCPASEQYKPRVPLYLHLLKEKKRALLDEADRAYKKDFLQWQVNSEKIKADNQKALEVWKAKNEMLIQKWNEDYNNSCCVWNMRKEEHEANQSHYNGGLDKLKDAYEAFGKEALEEYCRLVLARSEYPFSFSKDYQIEYNPEAKLLALDYQLPSIDVVPCLKEEKFIKSRGEVKRTLITDKQHREMYEHLLYSMVIRTIHEIFEADRINAIDAIAMNGWVMSINKATGHDETRCIMTISVNKGSFLKINLENVDVKECFKNLRGIGSAKLSELVPVAPVITLSREDHRFVEAYDVVEHIIEGENLALMNWEDFEHLIRELFEKEFSVNGGEVRVTQASRDGGVDAVIYDPDPIRGGKIIVQAKRYTNTVGVSAVRDLYGTVQHEGAMKGILITTSNYGSDAYDFAKGKPLTLMNGGNLIFMLEQHGRKARIDLAEAKRLMQA